VQDRFGLNWQLILADGDVEQKIIPSLLFVGDKSGHAEEAINFYASIFDH
jgi:predicted 3-demethylubiquinone-9 3-methyltransferase (glyoxalase superfamily)